MANILAVFDIGPPLDASGKPQVIGEVKYTSGFTRLVECTDLSHGLRLLIFYRSRPEPFECTIKPRNAQCAMLIRDAEVDVGL